MDASNVMLICPSCDNPAGSGEQKGGPRICKRCEDPLIKGVEGGTHDATAKDKYQ